MNLQPARDFPMDARATTVRARVRRSLVVRRRYDRYSLVYDGLEAPLERLLFHHWRPLLFAGLNPGARVLEVGAGTGKNFRYYPPETQPAAIDFSPRMLARARRRAPPGVELCQADAQSLPFPNQSFDRVVGSFVFCSVPDPVQGFRELARVVRRGGEVRLVEHVLSRNRVLAALERLGTPVTRLAFGYNLDRPTPHHATRGGLRLVEDRCLALGDVFRFLRAVPA